jgi:hypothetical protein
MREGAPALWQASQGRLHKEQQQAQNVWTFCVIIVCIGLHLYSTEKIFGEFSTFLKLGSVAVAGICIYGSIMFMNKAQSVRFGC